MAKHLLRNIIAAGGLAVAAVLAGAGDARAFTETAVTPPAGQSAPAKMEKEGAPAAPQLQIEKSPDGKGIALTTPGTASKGTEVKIPGVGSLGTLPKLDFGLELLYGGNGDPAAAEKRDSDKEDVQIKGSIKHRF